MKTIFIILLIFLIFTGCKKSEPNTIGKNERLELIPEPDKEERLKYEAIMALKKDTCKSSNPDISISNIIIRDYESTEKTIGNDNTLDLNEEYHFYSKSKKEILTLHQHPGDGKYDISIFKVIKSNKTDSDYKVLDIEKFESEKGVKLGVSKTFIINNLGKCYTKIVHSENYNELYYRIEQPNDSKSKLLETYNMPVYYASYKFLNDTLFAFEFGFEYP